MASTAKHPGHALIALALPLAALIAFPGCGGDSGKKGGADARGGGSQAGQDAVKPGDEDAFQQGVPGGQQAGEEEHQKGKAAVTPGELRRLTEAIQALKDYVFLNDPDSFQQSFIDVEALKSVVVKFKGADVWKAMVAQAGGDEVVFRSSYRSRIRGLFDGLRRPGDKCELDEAAIGRIRNAAKPPLMLLADTFYTPEGRNLVVVLAGFSDSESPLGLFRIRAMPHHNQLKWHLVGDEILEDLSANRKAERSYVSGALAAIASEQESFRKSKSLDRDGDSITEFGFLGELGGAEPLRGTEKTLYEGSLPRGLREVSVNGAALSRGFMFRVLLPGKKEGEYRDHPSSAEPAELTDLRERVWCAAAWPVSPELGSGLYFVGPSGKVLVSKSPSPYFGIEKAPPAGIGFAESGEKAARCAGTALSGPGRDGAGIDWEQAE